MSGVRKARTLAEREEKLAQREEKLAESEARRWGPDVLYHGRRIERRIMILELMAWAIERVETFPTRDQAEAFFAELREARQRTWGIRPWREIEDDEQFSEHVLDIAETFANSERVEEAWYPNRSHQPEGAEYAESR
jgi:hypothetical protein